MPTSTVFTSGQTVSGLMIINFNNTAWHFKASPFNCVLTSLLRIRGILTTPALWLKISITVSSLLHNGSVITQPLSKTRLHRDQVFQTRIIRHDKVLTRGGLSPDQRTSMI